MFVTKFPIPDSSLMLTPLLHSSCLMTYVVDKAADFTNVDIGFEGGRIADCMALAQYYDLLHVVAPRLSRDLKITPHFWRHVSNNPGLYMALGRKLEDEEIFVEAFRHFVGSQYHPSNAIHTSVYDQPGDKRGQNMLPEIDGWEGFKAELMVAKYREKMTRLAKTMDNIVRGAGWNEIAMSYQEHGDPNGDNFYTRCERYFYLARAIVSEWYDSCTMTQDLLMTFG